MVGERQLDRVSNRSKLDSRKGGARTLPARLHGGHDSPPGVHDALPEGHNVVEHLVGALGRSSDGGRLLQNLGNDGQIGLEVALNGNSDIAEAL